MAAVWTSTSIKLDPDFSAPPPCSSARKVTMKVDAQCATIKKNMVKYKQFGMLLSVICTRFRIQAESNSGFRFSGR